MTWAQLRREHFNNGNANGRSGRNCDRLNCIREYAKRGAEGHVYGYCERRRARRRHAHRRCHFFRERCRSDLHWRQSDGICRTGNVPVCVWHCGCGIHYGFLQRRYKFHWRHDRFAAFPYSPIVTCHSPLPWNLTLQNSAPPQPHSETSQICLAAWRIAMPV